MFRTVDQHHGDGCFLERSSLNKNKFDDLFSEELAFCFLF